MRKYFDFVEGTDHRPIAGASVRVTLYPSGDLAQIFSDDAGSVSAQNPLRTDKTGYYEFYIPDGHYTIEVSGSGLAGKTIADVVIYDPVPAKSSLTDADEIAWDMAGGKIVSLALTSARATRKLKNPSRPRPEDFALIIKQYVNGGQTITFDTAYVLVGDVTIDPAAGSTTILRVFSDGETHYVARHGGPIITAAPAPAPAPAPTPAPAPAGPPITASFAAGVNLSGMEWAAPGVRYGQSTYPDINYTVARAADIAYLASQGVTLVRLPLTWELLQPLRASSPANTTVVAGYDSSLGTYAKGNLWEPYAQYVDKILDACQAAGIKCVLDVHNYCRYKDFVYQSDGSVIGWTRPADKLLPPYTSDNTQVVSTIFAKVNPTLTQADFTDLWTKMVMRWKNHAGLGGYSLMNEPNNMPAVGKNFGINAYPAGYPSPDFAEDWTIWNTYAKAAVDVIRPLDGTTTIYVGGNYWQSPIGWDVKNPMFPLTGPNATNIIYDFHLYLDATNGGFRFDWDDEVAKGFSAGESGTITSATGTNRINLVTAWAAANGNQILACTEFGIPIENKSDGTLDTRWLSAAAATVTTLKNNNIQTFTWMGGNHWPIHAYPINHVPKLYQGKTVNPIAGAYLLGALGTNNAIVFDEGGQWSSGGSAVTVKVQARGNLTSAVTLTLASDQGGTFSKTTLTLAAGVNSEDSYTFTPASNKVTTITYTRTGGGQVPPARKVYSLTDPVAYASTSLTDAAKAIMAKYSASCWLASDSLKEYLTPAAAAAGDYIRGISDSGSGSTIENPMEAINWLNQDAGSIRSTQIPAKFNNDPDGKPALDLTVYGRRGLLSRHLAPVVAAGPSNDNYRYPACRMPFDMTDPHFMVAAFMVTNATTSGTVMAAQEMVAASHTALRVSAGKVRLDQSDVNGLINRITDTASLSTNTITTAACVSSQGSQKLRVNGAQVGGTTTVSFATSPFSTASIGYGYWNYYPQDAIQGYGRAYIMGRGTPTDAEITVLENYAKA